jgi:hypothetical protein
MADSAYQQLIYKLDAFIRKYYKNQVIRGIIYTVGALAVFFLLTNLVEFFGHLGMLGRAILFYGYLIVAFGILKFKKCKSSLEKLLESLKLLE